MPQKIIYSRSGIFQFLAALVAVLLLVSVLPATIVEKKSVEELVRGAEWIVEGSVRSVKSGHDRMGSIATFVEIQATRALRGPSKDEIVTFSIPGGEIGGRGFIIAGMPAFQAGEECLLFLTETSVRGVRVPVGLGQGHLRIATDPSTGLRRFTRELSGLDMLDIKTGRPVPLQGDTAFEYKTFHAGLEKLIKEDNARRSAAGVASKPATKGGK